MVLTAGGTTDLGLPAFATFVDNGDGTGTFTFAPGPDDGGNLHDHPDGHRQRRRRRPVRGPVGLAELRRDGQQSRTGRRTSPPSATRWPSSASRCNSRSRPPTPISNPLTFSALGLPAGATLTPSSTYGEAVVTWTPAAERPGPVDRRLHGRRQRQRQSRRHPHRSAVDQHRRPAERPGAGAGPDRRPDRRPAADAHRSRSRPPTRTATRCCTRPPTCRPARRSTRSPAC